MTPTDAQIEAAGRCPNCGFRMRLQGFFVAAKVAKVEDAPVFNMIDTWNSGDIPYNATKMNVTDVDYILYHSVGDEPPRKVYDSTAAAEVGARRALKETDAFCPSCGHNRDKSSVSSIDHGSFKSCQKCGAEWTETAAAEVGDKKAYSELLAADLADAEKEIETLRESLSFYVENGTMGPADLELATIERCAQRAHDWLEHHGYPTEASECAAAIRALLKEKTVSDAFGGPFPEEEP